MIAVTDLTVVENHARIPCARVQEALGYRDVVGVLTIGAGLTAASGVIKPRVGMVITRAEATALLQKALASTYEPAVEMAMTRTDKMPVELPLQHEFDAGVSFHWNCGTIGKATWVKSWRAKAPRALIRKGLLAWNKGGGKVLPGLTDRRGREADMLLDGIYRSGPASRPNLAINLLYAQWGIGLTSTEKNNTRLALNGLGYAAGDKLDAIDLDAARKFQRDHGLTVDGIIGRATLSTLQRALDARSKTKAVALVSAPPTAAVVAPQGSFDLTDQILALPWVPELIFGGLALWALSIAWRYRDIVAAAIDTPLPRVAAFLRSF